LFADQFGDNWSAYFDAIEAATPRVAALGITDYFIPRAYTQFLARRGARCAQVELVFPNIEMRYSIETDRAKALNVHLLVSPEQPDHIAVIGEKLATLTFDYEKQGYACNEVGLRRLGRAFLKNSSLDDEQALRTGASQFKVNFAQLSTLLKDEWMRRNVLVAVASGGDGLQGLRSDTQFAALTAEIGRTADIIFSPNEKVRGFWLGGSSDFKAFGHKPTPCLHGSDAHSIEKVLRPDSDRRCWLRSEPTFDGLRQALIEPDRRVCIGPLPPAGPTPSDRIRTISFQGANWLRTPQLPLNSGLVTVIGPRGSGKTALADLTAAAAASYDDWDSEASFIAKADGLLDGLEVELEWGDGLKSKCSLSGGTQTTDEPRVRYLSQRFVERLCAPDEPGRLLLEEIERVVFAAIPEEERLECSSFSALRALRVEGLQADHALARREIEQKSLEIAAAIALRDSLPALKAKRQEAERMRGALEQELKAIPVTGKADRIKAHEIAVARLKQLKDALAAEDRRRQNIVDVQAESQRQLRSFIAEWESLKSRYPGLLTESTWLLLMPRLAAEADARLADLISAAALNGESLRARGIPSDAAWAASDRAPSQAGLAAMATQVAGLAKELGLGQANATRRLDVEKRLAQARANEARANVEVAASEAAPTRIHSTQERRLALYEAVFETLLAEQRVLDELYGPLQTRIAEDARLDKLSFAVARRVDLDGWVRRGEQLLDGRKSPFRGDGGLALPAKRDLLPSWLAGSPADNRAAMATFLKNYGMESAKALTQDATLVMFSDWLFATDHIQVNYDIAYEGIEIARLSPGSRGMVLLTLYLALDRWDPRPLVIDQPEENLDPGSINSELVPFFREASRRRQIILVTHNANLVVNADSDQVIVTSASRHSTTGLPEVVYAGGGLEDSHVRADVCRLLEGGEEALRKRWMRYGVSI
jgi:energy-coupling factor transporter ATP-binding protein EcfA2